MDSPGGPAPFPKDLLDYKQLLSITAALRGDVCRAHPSRREPRLPMQGKVLTMAVSLADTARTPQVAMVRDVSQHGMGLLIQGRLPVEAPVLVGMREGGENPSICWVLGIVMNRDDANSFRGHICHGVKTLGKIDEKWARGAMTGDAESLLQLCGKANEGRPPAKPAPATPAASAAAPAASAPAMAKTSADTTAVAPAAAKVSSGTALKKSA